VSNSLTFNNTDSHDRAFGNPNAGDLTKKHQRDFPEMGDCARLDSPVVIVPNNCLIGTL
jgi:hypothetical protein